MERMPLPQLRSSQREITIIHVFDGSLYVDIVYVCAARCGLFGYDPVFSCALFSTISSIFSFIRFVYTLLYRFLWSQLSDR